MFVVGVLVCRDELGEPGRALEQHEQAHGAESGPAVDGLGSVTAPVVEHQPNGLLRGKVWMSAVSPETRRVEALVQLLKRIWRVLGHLARCLVLPLAVLVI